jgi:tripartite-type tricarboxylate transporter receptor subunit TctC
MRVRPGMVLATLVTTSLLVVASTPASPLRAQQSVESFYAGKTITILIGFPPGGTYDIYARMTASHFSRFMPGRPTIQVQSRPGGSGIGAVNYFTANAPKDGMMLGMFTETLAIVQLTEPQLGKWNTRDFTYIGSFANSNGVFVVRKDAPAVTVDAMRKTPVHVGCNGRTGASYINPALMKAYAGLKFEIHCGYPGSNDISIALARGEIDVTAGTWIAWRSRSHILDGTVRPVIQAGLKRHKEMPDVPLMQELIADRKQFEVAEFLSSGSPIGRALLVPRTVPAERVAALRKAFMEMTADPKFVQDTTQSGLELDPLPGEELDRITAKILDTPADIVALARSVGK